MKKIVNVQVQEVRHCGIFVQLEDGRNGYIRCREISWDRRVGLQPEMPAAGNWFNAVIIEEDSEQEMVFLSLREINDPWEDFKNNPRFQPEQIVVGEVVNIRSFAAYIQLEPGIEAILYPEDALLTAGKALNDELVVGDRVAGWIESIDVDNRVIRFSLVKAQQQIRSASDNWREWNRLFSNFDFPTIEQSSELSKANRHQEKFAQIYHSPITAPERFLVIDDDPKFLEEVSNRLEQQFRIPVNRCLSGLIAANFLRANPGSFGLVLIDYYLDNENGIDVASQLQAIAPTIRFIFMSWAPNHPANQLQAREFKSAPFIDKQLDNIVDWVDRLFTGYVEVRPIIGVEDTNEDRFIRELEQAVFSSLPLAEKLSLTLKTIRQEIQANYLILIELEPIHHHIQVVSARPQLSSHLTEGTGGLDYSQARNVIEDEMEFHKNAISETEKQSRFRNLFPNISFQSCLGIPISIPDQATRYALFLLDRRPWFFSLKHGRSSPRVRQARLAARYLGQAIERDYLFEQLRAADEKASLGELMADMFHELWGKRSALAIEIENLQSLLPKPYVSAECANREEENQLVEHIVEIDQGLKTLLEAYQHLLNQDFQPINILVVLDKVLIQLRSRAKEQDVELRFEAGNDLPQVWGVQAHLEQVLLNLIMNAIQQIVRFRPRIQPFFHNDDAQEKKQPAGLIQVQITYERTIRRVQILVADTGPGIHRLEQSHIFKRGVSNRGGYGLGLTISRNLVERMHGRLFIPASILYIGSIFLVDFPAYFPKRPNDGKK